MTTKKSPTDFATSSSPLEPLAPPTLQVTSSGKLRVTFHDYAIDFHPSLAHIKILMQMLELRQFGNGAQLRLGEPGSLTSAQIAELVKKAKEKRRKYNIAIDLRSLGL